MSTRNKNKKLVKQQCLLLSWNFSYKAQRQPMNTLRRAYEYELQCKRRNSRWLGCLADLLASENAHGYITRHEYIIICISSYVCDCMWVLRHTQPSDNDAGVTWRGLAWLEQRR